MLLKKIITVSRPTTLRVFLVERSGYLTKWGNWGGGEYRSKSLNFPLQLDKSITDWEIPRKNVSLIAFRWALNFACIVDSVTQLWLYWKSSIKTKSLNTKPCPAELSPRIICQTSPFLLKMTQNCCTHQVWTVPPFSELLE